MSRLPSALTAPADRQAGLLYRVDLPDEGWKERWERIVCPSGTKDRLLNGALFCTTRRPTLSSVGLPSHGLLVIAGPPGCGKTTLAQGLADQVGRVLRSRGVAEHVRFAMVDAHALPSELLGQSQRGIVRLFERIIPDLAEDGTPVVVLLDEVEALAVNRRRTSTETNPADVHRSTEAVLTGIDQLASAASCIVFVATTNFPEAVDEALLSRADLVEHLGPPTAEVARAILADTLAELPGGGADVEAGELDSIGRRCADSRLDARQVRKLVLRALVSDDVALALGERPLRAVDLNRALELELSRRTMGGGDV